MSLIKIAGAVTIVAVLGMNSACSTTVRNRNTGSLEAAKKHGPPPHAPAHGYRHKYGNAVLVFDTALKVYVVKGRSNHYFHDKHYYRTTSNGWELTPHLEGPWKPVSTKKLPKGLRNSVQAKKSTYKKKKKKKE